jgi:hypothetical protein
VRLQNQQGVPSDGHERLATAFDSFREGWTTPDLAAARVLLGR